VTIKDSVPISGVDIAWLRMDSPTNLMVINSMIITEPMSFADYRSVVLSRFLSFPRFMMRPVHAGGQYWWERDPYFDLDSHVKRVALPGKADKKALQQYVADQISIPLDPSKPLWQMLFVENFVGGTAIITRAHHCYADGMALMSVFNHMTDASANVTMFTSGNKVALLEEEQALTEINYEWPRYQRLLDSAADTVGRATDLARRISEEGWSLLRDREHLKEVMSDGVRALSTLAQLAVMPADPKRVLKGELGVRKSCAWSEPINLDRFHSIAKGIGCKINDLLLSCVAGAFRDELIHAGQDVEGKCIHVTLPVNIRSPETYQSKAFAENLGNCFGTVFVPLPVGIENPLERVYKLKHDMIALKGSMQPALSFGMLSVAGLFPLSLQKPVLESFGNKTTAVLSNVPGARTARYLAGARIREMMFWVPQTGDLGLGLSIISYNSQIQFGLVGDARLFPNPERLVNRFVAQIEQHRIDIVASYIEDLVQPAMASS
jgi:WS/DGAT/MGAT family acyltransferase